MIVHVGVDPGARHAGVAVYVGAELALARLLEGGDRYEVARALDQLLIEMFSERCRAAIEADEPAFDLEAAVEKPRVYRRGRGRGRKRGSDRGGDVDPNDLVDVAMTASALGTVVALMGGRVVEYRPATWKGQASKDVVEKRLREKLLPEEVSAVVLPSTKDRRSDVWDAVGIGEFHLRALRSEQRLARFRARPAVGELETFWGRAWLREVVPEDARGDVRGNELAWWDWAREHGHVSEDGGG